MFSVVVMLRGCLHPTCRVDALPATAGRTVLWQRAILPLSFGVAVLAGVGMDALVRAHAERAVRRWTGGGFAASAVLLAGSVAVRSGRPPGG